MRGNHMKSWYLTKQGTNRTVVQAGFPPDRTVRAINHCGQDIPVGKKLYLTEEQAALHGDSLVKTSDPIGNEAAVQFDLAEWKEVVAPKSVPNPTTESKSKK